MSANYDDDWRSRGRASKDVIAVDFPGKRRAVGVVDPRDQFAKAPQYQRGQLPDIFENFVTDNIAAWGGDPGPYAASFLAMHCGVLHSSVKVQTNPDKPNIWRNPNDFALILGRSGTNKSGMFKDLTRFQMEWQRAMTRAAAKQVTGARAKHPPMCFLQNASVEGMMMQIADNRGERLLMGSEEAMGFYDGAGAHHRERAASVMSDTVCQVYDGGMFSKRLVNKSFTIPEALATLIMTTVVEKVVSWGAFNAMVESGLMARHTVSCIAYPQPRDAKRLIPGAEAAMGDVMLKLRGLRNVNFVLSPEAVPRWLDFVRRKEEEIVRMEEGDVKLGLVNWCKKYDMRIMSLASILQAYRYIAGGSQDCSEQVVASTEDDAGKVDGGTKVVRTIFITVESLQEAVRFTEGYLKETQRFFYDMAAGVTEFGKELMNFVASRITRDDPDNPEGRIIPRTDLCERGPACVRGAITDTLKAKRLRWIQALLDHGYIEVYEHPRQRNLKKPRADNEERWFKLRDELFEFFASDDDRNWLRSLYNRMMKIDAGPSAPLDL